MLTVEKRPGNNIKITNISSKISYQNLELYFFIRLDLKLSSDFTKIYKPFLSLMGANIFYCGIL